jgi:ankyrin repeat protein
MQVERGANLSLRNDEGDTPLHLAAFHGHAHTGALRIRIRHAYATHACHAYALRIAARHAYATHTPDAYATHTCHAYALRTAARHAYATHTPDA